MSLDDREWYHKARGRLRGVDEFREEDTIAAKMKRREPTEFEQLLGKPRRSQRGRRVRIVALVVGVALVGGGFLIGWGVLP